MTQSDCQANLVARRFSSAQRYHQFATVQQHFEKRVYQRASQWVTPGDCVVDLGAGPALGLSQWVDDHPAVIPFAVDFAFHALRRVQHSRVVPVCSNAHHLPFANESVAMVVSNFALQWCEPELALSEIHRVLKPGGYALLTMPVAGSLIELHAASSAIGESIVNELPDASAWQRGIKGGLKNGALIHCEQRSHCDHYPSVLALMRAIRETGASTRLNRTGHGLKTKQWLQAMERGYPKVGDTDEVVATWQVLEMVVRKAEESCA